MPLDQKDLKAIKSIVDTGVKEGIQDLPTKEYLDQGFEKMHELITAVETNLTDEITRVDARLTRVETDVSLIKIAVVQHTH